jgi:hypothetical protein
MGLDVWCRHFTGIQNEKCEAGVEYVSVRDSKPGRMHQWPCTNPAIRHMCPLFEAYTTEEIAEHNRKVAESINSLIAFESREIEECPHCGTWVTRLKQVGRCVYSEPCGCRLWQGRVPEAWK